MHSDAAYGWQTVFADLSIILFMTTALAVNEGLPAKAAPPHAPVDRGEAVPVAVWRKTAGGEPLDHWLADQGRDPRIRFTFIVQHKNAAGPQEKLMALAQMTGRETRIRFEAGTTNDVIAIARYEGVDAGLPAGEHHQADQSRRMK